MKLRVLEAFSPTFGTNYNVGDEIEIEDEKTAKALIDSHRAVSDADFKSYENFNLFAPQVAAKQSVVQQVAAAVKAVPAVTKRAKRK